LNSDPISASKSEISLTGHRFWLKNKKGLKFDEVSNFGLQGYRHL